MNEDQTLVPAFRGIPTSAELQQAALSEEPLVLGIPLAASRGFRKCQLNCGFCFVEREERGDFLTLRDHLEVIDEFATCGGRYVRTATVGEPFLDRMFFNPDGGPDAFEPEDSRFPLITHANRRGLFWTSFSNLIGVTEAVAEELAELDVSLIGKLHAMEPAVQESMTGNTGHYAEHRWRKAGGRRVPQGLKRLIDAGFCRSKPGEPSGTTRLAVDIVVTKVNFRHIPEVVSYCLENRIYPFLEMLELFGDATANLSTFGMTSADLEWLAERLIGLVGSDFFAEEARARTNRFCPAYSAGLIYNPDGSVRYCYCANAGRPWNVRLHGLAEIYSELGRERSELRKRLECIHAPAGERALLEPCPMGAHGRVLTGQMAA